MWRGQPLARQNRDMSRDGPTSHIFISWSEKDLKAHSRRGFNAPPLTKIHCELSSLPKCHLRTTGLLNTVVRGFAKTRGINLVMTPALQSFPRINGYLTSSTSTLRQGREMVCFFLVAQGWGAEGYIQRYACRFKTPEGLASQFCIHSLWSKAIALLGAMYHRIQTPTGREISSAVFLGSVWWS